MRRHVKWAIFGTITAVLGAGTTLWLLPWKMALTRSQLTLGGPPPPPAQPTTETLSCTNGSSAMFEGGPGKWSFAQDHPPCTFVGCSPPAVKAMASEILMLKHRPRFLFQVAANGGVRNASILQTSGSKTLDEKSLTQIKALVYQRHNCGVCTISTVVSVEFEGPVWVPESAK